VSCPIYISWSLSVFELVSVELPPRINLEIFRSDKLAHFCSLSVLDSTRPNICKVVHEITISHVWIGHCESIKKISFLFRSSIEPNHVNLISDNLDGFSTILTGIHGREIYVVIEIEEVVDGVDYTRG